MLTLFFLRAAAALGQSSESITNLELQYREAINQTKRLTATLEQAQQDNQALRQQIQQLRRPPASAQVPQVGTQPGVDYEKMMARLSREIDANPARVELYIQRAVAQMTLKRFPQAIQDFNAAIARGQQTAVIYNQRGIAHFQCGQMDNAIRDFTRAIKQDSQLGQAYNNRGIAQRHVGDYAAAIGDLRQASRLGLQGITPQVQMLRQEVRRAQQQLQHAGLQPGRVDGVFGAQTRGALRAYQTRKALPPTGRLDPVTQQHLNLQGRHQLVSPRSEPELLSYFVHRPAPVYPVIARQQGWEGTVTLRFKMLVNGTIDQVDIVKSTGHPILDEAAQHAMQQWAHSWGQQDQSSEARWGTLNFVFALNGGGQK